MNTTERELIKLAAGVIVAKNLKGDFTKEAAIGAILGASSALWPWLGGFLMKALPWAGSAILGGQALNLFRPNQQNQQQQQSSSMLPMMRDMMQMQAMSQMMRNMG